MPERLRATETTTEFGRGFARRIRAAGKIPAVLYGQGTDPRHVTLQSREFSHAIKGGANTVLTLALPDGDELALAKSVVRHPLRDYFDHVDLIIVKRGEKVTVDVPLVVSQQLPAETTAFLYLPSVSIEVEALHIPRQLTVNVADLPVWAVMVASDIVLPEGATLVSPEDTPVLRIVPLDQEEAAGSALKDVQDLQFVARVEFLIGALGAAARLAEILGVSRSQPTRWRQGIETPGPEVAARLLDLDHVMARTQLLFRPEIARTWLASPNAFLDGARPIDVFRVSGASEVVAALDATEAGAFA